MRPTLLVSAGEGSGDAMAAAVVRRLGVSAFGLGGPALGAAGVELTSELSRFTAMGVGSVVARAPQIAVAGLGLLDAARQRRPPAALLVGYSEFNAWLGRRLRRLGTRVLWYAPPQIWAWRPERGAKLRDACDRMAVILPFEEQLWRSFGVDAHFVGHPALERPPVARDAIRERVGMTPYAEYLALLPGSRPHEVRSLLGPMLGAVGLLRGERGALDARVVLAPALDPQTVLWASRLAVAAGISVLETSATAVLPAFDAALAASGSVTLECVAADVPPVIAYRVGPLSEALARRWLKVDAIGLPNILLGEKIFPELVQDAVAPEALADGARRMLDQRAEWLARCGQVQRRLAPEDDRGSPLYLTGAPSARVARLLSAWLS